MSLFIDGEHPFLCASAVGDGSLSMGACGNRYIVFLGVAISSPYGRAMCCRTQMQLFANREAGLPSFGLERRYALKSCS